MNRLQTFAIAVLMIANALKMSLVMLFFIVSATKQDHTNQVAYALHFLKR